ncbi:MAG TPA: cytochrome C oxidase subunit IV family protein [Symbiobacteriaceae bacterium]|nr:cytochrome C oxidase subunit IV family protein [Symbiobacteriaceae bacterium]
MHVTTPGVRHQPATRTYVAVAGILAAVTLLEFSVLYLRGIRHVVLPLLFVLSVVKFLMVAGYFMHLKVDSKVFGFFFGAGVFLAAVVVVSLAVLLSVGHVGHAGM